MAGTLSNRGVAVGTKTGRRWRFRVTDWDDREFLLDADGREAGDTEPWIGTEVRALAELCRRINLWEERTGGGIDRGVTESLGCENAERT